MRFTDEEGATEKMKECCPGQPHILFSKKPGIKIEFINPVPHSGLFNEYVTISDGDSYSNVVSRLAKNIRIIKGVCLFLLLLTVILIIFVLDSDSIKLWRLEDPNFGDLKMPLFNEPTNGKILIPTDSVFKVDIDKQKVSISSAGHCHYVGQIITYLV